MPSVVRSVVSEKRTARLTPCMSRVPDALYVALAPTAGTVPRTMGAVSVKVAVGYWATSMIRPSNCALRWLWSLTTLAMSTPKVPDVTASLAIETDPQIFDVLPTAVACWPTSTSDTRYPASEPDPT